MRHTLVSLGVEVVIGHATPGDTFILAPYDGGENVGSCTRRALFMVTLVIASLGAEVIGND